MCTMPLGPAAETAATALPHQYNRQLTACTSDTTIVQLQYIYCAQQASMVCSGPHFLFPFSRHRVSVLWISIHKTRICIVYNKDGQRSPKMKKHPYILYQNNLMNIFKHCASSIAIKVLSINMETSFMLIIFQQPFKTESHFSLVFF